MLYLTPILNNLCYRIPVLNNLCYRIPVLNNLCYIVLLFLTTCAMVFPFLTTCAMVLVMWYPHAYERLALVLFVSHCIQCEDCTQLGARRIKQGCWSTISELLWSMEALYRTVNYLRSKAGAPPWVAQGQARGLLLAAFEGGSVSEGFDGRIMEVSLGFSVCKIDWIQRL